METNVNKDLEKMRGYELGDGVLGSKLVHGRVYCDISKITDESTFLRYIKEENGCLFFKRVMGDDGYLEDSDGNIRVGGIKFYEVLGFNEDEDENTLFIGLVSPKTAATLHSSGAIDYKPDYSKYRIGKMVHPRDMVVGEVYSDAPQGCSSPTFLKFYGVDEGRSCFSYVGGCSSYGKSIGDVILFDDDSDFYELIKPEQKEPLTTINSETLVVLEVNRSFRTSDEELFNELQRRGHSIKAPKLDVSKLTDMGIIKELRQRGYEITAHGVLREA